MTDSTTLIFASGAALLLAMPGPSNALLAAAGAARGLADTGRLLLAELAGYVLALSLLLGLDMIAGSFRTETGLALRSASAVLLLALAVRMWRGSGGSDPAPGTGARQLFLLTVSNPKSLVLAFALFPPMIEDAMLAHAILILTVLVVVTGFAWIVAGAATRAVSSDATKAVGRLSSLVIGGFALYFAVSVIRDIIPRAAI